MLIGYKRPRNVSWTLNGVGSSFLTDIRLDNGKPADLTQIQWISSGSPITDYLDLRGDWGTSQNIRTCGLIGLRVGIEQSGSPSTILRTHMPAGVRVVVTGKRVGDLDYTYALGGNSTTARTMTLPDGTTAVWFVLDANIDYLIGIQFRFYNDDDSNTFLDGSDLIEIGEAALLAGVEVNAIPGWTIKWTDPTVVTRTLAGQAHRVVRQAWREFDFGLVPTTENEVRASGLANDQDYEKITAALLYAEPCAFIAHWKDENGVFNENLLHRTAVFGIATPGALSHIIKRISSHSFHVAELPAASTLPSS